MPKETSAGAIIFRKEPRRRTSSLRGRDNEIYYLLLHYDSGPARNVSHSEAGGHWDFPKGHIKEGELEEDTVKREVLEETGIKDIEIIKGFKEWVKYVFRRTYNLKKGEKNKAPWVFKTVTFYLAETKTKKVKISFEHLDYKWLPYEQALKQLTFKNAKEILKKANDYLISKKGF